MSQDHTRLPPTRGEGQGRQEASATGVRESLLELLEEAVAGEPDTSRAQLSVRLLRLLLVELRKLIEEGKCAQAQASYHLRLRHAERAEGDLQRKRADALYEALEAVTRSTEWSCMEADIQDAVMAALSLAHTEPSQGEK